MRTRANANAVPDDTLTFARCQHELLLWRAAKLDARTVGQRNIAIRELDIWLDRLNHLRRVVAGLAPVPRPPEEA